MISVIIPTLNEEACVPDVIKYIFGVANKDEVEIIVADGGSTDNTIKKSLKAGAKVVHASREGRAVQMNEGAKAAQGEYLFFLHADTYPPKSFVEDVNNEFSQRCNAGCYCLSFDNPNKALKWYGWFTKFDIDLFRFGDQGLFISRSFFDEIGGFDDALSVMEDQEIIKRIKAKGTFCISDKKVITSARKYEIVGVFKLQLIFTLILVLYYAGIDQERLSGIYQRLLSKSGY